MKTPIELDGILYGLLRSARSQTPALLDNNGGIYTGDGGRPSDSVAEDVVINTIDLGQESLPQTGTSNINIYVADKAIRIGGKDDIAADRVRIDNLAKQVLSIIRSSVIVGMKGYPTNYTVIREISSKQHYANIRIEWNIQN